MKEIIFRQTHFNRHHFFRLTHKITVQAKLPTVKLSPTTAKLISLFPEMVESVTPVLSQSNLRLKDVTCLTPF